MSRNNKKKGIDERLASACERNQTLAEPCTGDDPHCLHLHVPLTRRALYPAPGLMVRKSFCEDGWMLPRELVVGSKI